MGGNGDEIRGRGEPYEVTHRTESIPWYATDTCGTVYEPEFDDTGQLLGYAGFVPYGEELVAVADRRVDGLFILLLLQVALTVLLVWRMRRQ